MRLELVPGTGMQMRLEHLQYIAARGVEADPQLIDCRYPDIAQRGAEFVIAQRLVRTQVFPERTLPDVTNLVEQSRQAATSTLLGRCAFLDHYLARDCVLDRYGICLDWSMGYPRVRRKSSPRGIGLTYRHIFLFRAPALFR